MCVAYVFTIISYILPFNTKHQLLKAGAIWLLTDRIQPKQRTIEPAKKKKPLPWPNFDS